MLLFEMVSHPRSAVDNKQLLLTLSDRTLVTVVHLLLITVSDVMKTILPYVRCPQASCLRDRCATQVGDVVLYELIRRLGIWTRSR